MVRYHGNWCGPNWTAGQYKSADEITDEDRNVPAIDALDQCCKDHDIGLADYPERAEELNMEFALKARSLGVKGKLAAIAVELFGPSKGFTKKTDSVLEWIERIQMEREDILSARQPFNNIPAMTRTSRKRQSDTPQMAPAKRQVVNWAIDTDGNIQDAIPFPDEQDARNVPLPDDDSMESIPDLGDLIPENTMDTKTKPDL